MKQITRTRKKRHLKPLPAMILAVVVFLAAAGLVYDRYGSYWKRSSVPVKEVTAAVPEEYSSECTHAGTVVKMEYPSKDYLKEEEITKPAYVYLPYGYDESGSTRYDVLYMIHGWMMRAQDYLLEEHQIKNMFDHLIESGQTKPFIVISLTFDADNEPQTYEYSVEELALFHYELREYAMPYLEAQLPTYAQSTSLRGLKKARDHRAFAGFSMGAVTAWHQFIFNLDFIRSFIPMSGDSWITGANGGLLRPDATVNRFVKPIHHGFYGLDDYFIYACTGAHDPMYENVDTQVQEMMRRQEFCAENMVYGIKEDGYHDMKAVREYLYNALPRIFPGSE